MVLYGLEDSLQGQGHACLGAQELWASVIQKVTKQNFRASGGSFGVFRQSAFWEARQHTIRMHFWPGPLETRHSK